MGLNDSMALGAYNVIKDKPAYKNVYVAAAADGQKEGVGLDQRGGLQKPIHLDRAQLAIPCRRGCPEDRSRYRDRGEEAQRLSPRSPSPRP